MKGATASASGVRLVCGPASVTLADPARPHILLVVDQLAKTLGGGERVLLRLARELPRHGFRVSILTLSLDPESPALQNPPCPIFLLPIQRTWDWHAVRSAFALRRFLRAEKIVLLQTFFESSDLWVGSIAKTVPGTALIWSRRDLGILRQRKHRVAYRLLARLPDVVFAVSDQVRSHVLACDRVPESRVVTVYNGIAVPERPESRRLRINPEESGLLRVTATGNLRPVKGFDLLLRAAALLAGRHPEMRISIAGHMVDPTCAAALLELRASLELNGQVEFLGNVSDIPALLARTDIFVLPSRSEGFSNAILEAMRAGLPIVATAVGGNAEALIDNVSGLLVPPEDVGALAAALERLMNDEILRSQLGEAAFARVRNEFSLDRMVEVTSLHYRRLL